VRVRADVRDASAEVIETGHLQNSWAHHPRHFKEVLARRAGCVERRSSGSTEARSRKGRLLKTKTNRAFYPMEYSPKNGGDREMPLREERPWWCEAGENPARGVSVETRAQRGWRGDFRSERSDGPGRNPKARGPPEGKRRPGRAQPREARTWKRLPVRPDRRRCRTANSPSRWVPESFCVLLGENSRPSARRLCRGDSRTYGMGVEPECS